MTRIFCDGEEDSAGIGHSSKLIVENVYVELQLTLVATNGAAALTDIIVDSTCVL